MFDILEKYDGQGKTVLKVMSFLPHLLFFPSKLYRCFQALPSPKGWYVYKPGRQNVLSFPENKYLSTKCDAIRDATAAKSLQSCPTLCDPIDSSSPGFPVPWILQARTLEWVAISFSNAWKWKVKVKSLSHVWFPVTPWTTAHQAPPSMGFSRQEYWSGVPLPSPFESILDHK